MNHNPNEEYGRVDGLRNFSTEYFCFWTNLVMIWILILQWSSFKINHNVTLSAIVILGHWVTFARELKFCCICSVALLSTWTHYKNGKWYRAQSGILIHLRTHSHFLKVSSFYIQTNSGPENPKAHTVTTRSPHQVVLCRDTLKINFISILLFSCQYMENIGFWAKFSKLNFCNHCIF